MPQSVLLMQGKWKMPVIGKIIIRTILNMF